MSDFSEDRNARRDAYPGSTVSNCAVFSVDRPGVPLGLDELHVGMEVFIPSFFGGQRPVAEVISVTPKPPEAAVEWRDRFDGPVRRHTAQATGGSLFANLHFDERLEQWLCQSTGNFAGIIKKAGE